MLIIYAYNISCALISCVLCTKLYPPDKFEYYKAVNSLKKLWIFL